VFEEQLERWQSRYLCSVGVVAQSDSTVVP
jgi:hypothetical protein